MAGNVSLMANSTNNADATQDSFGLSLVGAVKLRPQATDQHDRRGLRGQRVNRDLDRHAQLECHVDRQRQRLVQRHPGSCDRRSRTSTPRRSSKETRRPRSPARSRRST